MIDFLRKISSDIRAMANSIARGRSRKRQQVHGTIHFRIGAFFMRFERCMHGGLLGHQLPVGLASNRVCTAFFVRSEKAGFKNPLQQEMQLWKECN